MNTVMTAGELAKRRPLLTVNATTPVSEVMQLMAKNKVTAVCVMRRGKLSGVFTMKDVMTRVLGYQTSSIWRVPKKRKIKDVPVRVLMSANPHTVGSTQDMDQVMALMRRHRVRHLPVVEQDEIVGIVTLRDVIDAMRSQKSGRKEKKPLASMYFENPYADLAPIRARQ